MMIYYTSLLDYWIYFTYYDNTGASKRYKVFSFLTPTIHSRGTVRLVN